MMHAMPAGTRQPLGQLLGSLAVDPDVMISGVALDSRTIRGGELFLASSRRWPVALPPCLPSPRLPAS